MSKAAFTLTRNHSRAGDGRGRRGTHGGLGQTNRHSETKARARLALKHPPPHATPNQQEHNSTTARPAPSTRNTTRPERSTRNRAPKQPTRPGVTNRKPQYPENPSQPQPASTGRAIKVQGGPVPRVSGVGARRATHRRAGQGDGPRAAPIQKEAGRNGSPQQIRPWGPPSHESRRKPAGAVR